MGCPLCRGTAAHEVYRLDRVPATCSSIFDSAEEARAVPAGRVELVVCTACGFAYNRAFDSEVAAIGARYESTQAASPHFSKFAQGLAASWVDRYALAGKTVVEVGCGEGEFLRQMVTQGAGEAIGIDPLAPKVDPGTRCHYLNDLFGDVHLDIDAAALVCRHTLEHVPDAGDFLALTRRWAEKSPGRVVLFELPAADAIFDETAFWDIYYEHCNYFTEPVLRDAISRAGFEILRCERVYGGQYFIVEAVVGDPMPTMASAESELDRWRAFVSAAREAIHSAGEAFERFDVAGRPFAIWQGAAKTVGVLTACGVGEGLACAIDLNPGRHGRYLPGSGILVQAPHYLRSVDPANVVLMNPVYRDEVQQALDELAVSGRLWTITELCLPGQPVENGALSR